MHSMNPLAKELNEIIAKENPAVLEMMSTLGREMYFPKGIISQSAEAKREAKRFNATIGIADVNNLGDVSWLDFDNDGDLDIFAHNAPAGGNVPCRPVLRAHETHCRAARYDQGCLQRVPLVPRSRLARRPGRGET